MMNSLFFILFISIFSSCKGNIDKEYIIDREWVYDSGFKVCSGDFVSFETGFFSFRGDTLFVSGSPLGIVKALKKNKNEMIIMSLDKLKTGTYIDTQEFIQ